MGVFLERDHEQQVTDFQGYQNTIKAYRDFYRGSKKMDFAIWVLYKDEAAFQDAWRHTLFLSQTMRDHIIAEGKKVLESSAKIEEELINIDERIAAMKFFAKEQKAAQMQENAKEGNLSDTDISTAEGLFEEYARQDLIEERKVNKSLKEI